MNEAVGVFLRDYRAKNGYTLDQIAEASQRFGSGWSSGTLSLMERGGSKADALPNMLILVETLNHLDAERNHGNGSAQLSLGGLFDALGDSFIQIGDRVSIPATTLARDLDGGMIELEKWRVSQFSNERRKQLTVKWFRVCNNLEDFGIIADEDLFDGEHRFEILPTAAERRVARKLGVDPAIVWATCRAYYLHSLDEETASRAGEDASPQKRGRVTRDIIQELEQLVCDE